MSFGRSGVAVSESASKPFFVLNWQVGCSIATVVVVDGDLAQAAEIKCAGGDLLQW